MSLSEKLPIRKESHRLIPSGQEGIYIQYLLKATGQKFVDLAKITGVTPQFIPLVVFGQRRSKKIESEIAKILGHSSWNDVVLEARSEIQKKPVEVIVREMKQQQGKNDLAKSIKDNAHNAIFSKDWSAHLKAYAEEQAAAKNKKVKTRRRA